MNWIASASALGAVILLAGCNKPSPGQLAASSDGAAPPAEHPRFFVPTAAQGKLPTLKLWLGSEELDAEIAITPEQQATGMMFRTNLAENSGMIFIRPAPETASFWMTNCPYPLAAAYIDPSGTILETHELHANDPTPVVSASGNVQFVLEVNSHWFERHHISSGTLITTERGSLPELFLRRR